jgi:hypothetical protein
MAADGAAEQKGADVRYILLIHTDEKAAANATPEQQKQVMDAYNAFSKDIAERGLMLGGEALEPTSTATTVRVRGGEVLTTDGPFAETKEQLGGYYLVDCKDLDEAIEVAAKIPGAANGSIEVRPIWELPPEATA